MASIDNMRGGSNILASRKIIDMSNTIALLKPRTSPLTSLTRKLNKKPCMNYKFEWIK